MTFKGKTFVIMGATSGVGFAASQRLAAEGASLVLCGRNRSKLESNAERLETKKSLVYIDAASPDFEGELKRDLASAARELGAEKFGGGLYCPGIAPVVPLRGLDRDTVERVLNTNYTGAVLFSKVLSSKKFRAERSSIVLISSVRARSGEKGMGVYGASKAALEASARAFARELAPFGVRINCIAPGWLNTEMNAEQTALIGGLEEMMKKAHPLGFGRAEDVASAVAFLLSEDSEWITGTTVDVDGGFLS